MVFSRLWTSSSVLVSEAAERVVSPEGSTTLSIGTTFTDTVSGAEGAGVTEWVGSLPAGLVVSVWEDLAASPGGVLPSPSKLSPTP